MKITINHSKMVSALLILLLSFITSSQLSAHDIRAFDLNSYISSHPIFINFNPETKKMADNKFTESAIASLNMKLSKISNDLEEIDYMLKPDLNKLLSDFQSDDEYWNQRNSLQKKKSDLLEEWKKKRIELDEAEIELYNPHIFLKNSMRKLENDFLQMISSMKISSDSIFLNYLPEISDDPEINSFINPYYEFLLNGNKEKMEEYLKKSYHIGMFFKNSRLPVLYNKNMTSQ
ncbi:MAG: hypothetical protein HQM10_17720 [Candidatus Riflebacteria bacterium]|nr:hypothetical protein [Candidatus Riflebacteria bacterium]